MRDVQKLQQQLADIKEQVSGSVFLSALYCPIPPDHVPCLPGPAEEHDLPVRPRHLPGGRMSIPTYSFTTGTGAHFPSIRNPTAPAPPDVRGQDERVPDLPEDRGAQDSPLLSHSQAKDPSN